VFRGYTVFFSFSKYDFVYVNLRQVVSDAFDVTNALSILILSLRFTEKVQCKNIFKKI